jgi:hypothetical protein
MRQYLELIANVTKEATEDGIVYADCLCDRDIRHDWDPEYFTAWRKAVERWAHHCTFCTRFWGIHINGQHVIHVKNRYGLTWGGPRRFTPGA